MPLIRNVLIFFICFTSQGFAGDNPITVIHLKYQTATNIVPLIKSAFDDKTKVSGSKQVIIVRASQQNLAKIRSMVRQLDLPPEMLTVSVWFADQGKTIQHRRILKDIKTYRTSQSDESDDVQRVRVLSGYSAFINTGQISQQLDYAFVGIASAEVGFSEQERSTGFFVRPRLVGKEVIIDVSTQKEALNRFGQNKTDTGNLVTTVRTRLGEWIQLGGTRERDYSSQVRNVFQTSDSQQRKMIYLRVDKQAR